MNRETCIASLREATTGEFWLAKYALFEAANALDLHDLINLVDQVLVQAESREDMPPALRRLLRERWSVRPPTDR